MTPIFFSNLASDFTVAQRLVEINWVLCYDALMVLDSQTGIESRVSAATLNRVARPEFYLPSQYHWMNSKFGVHRTSVVASLSNESPEVKRVYDVELNCSVTSHLYRESDIGGDIDIVRAVNYGLIILSDTYYKKMEHSGLAVATVPDFAEFKNRFKESCWVSYGDSDFAIELNLNAFAHLDGMMRDEGASSDELSSAFDFFVSTQPFTEELFRKSFSISSDVFSEACSRTLGEVFALETAPTLAYLSETERKQVEKETAHFLSTRQWIVRPEQYM